MPQRAAWSRRVGNPHARVPDCDEWETNVKIPLKLTTDEDKRIWANAERTAAQVASRPPWKRGESPFAVALTCCGRDAGVIGPFYRWEDADEAREAYLSGPGVGLPTETRYGAGHSRSALIVDGARAGHETVP